MNSDEVMTDWSEKKQKHVESALYHLRQLGTLTKSLLLRIVAELCDENPTDILSVTDKVHISHARWFFWYSVRYMTSESYTKIALYNDTSKGHKFDAKTIQNGVNKIAMMIEEQPMWKKRWIIIKRIIKQYQEETETKKEETILIRVPKGIREQLKIKVEEK